MSHYCYDTNTFIISPHTGVDILRIFNKNNEKGEHFGHTGHKWIDGTLSMSGGVKQKRYKVYFILIILNMIL